MEVIVVYILFYFICIISICATSKTQNTILFIICFFLVFSIGFRDDGFWPDTARYAESFEQSTPPIYELKDLTPPEIYTERGFYVISSLIRTFTNSRQVYFFVIGIISIVLLYNILRKNCYPLIGLYVYIARFLLGRNFVQIRSGVAILLLVAGLIYMYENRRRVYAFIIAFASTIHVSCLIAIPTYFFALVKIPKKYLYIGIAISLLLSFYMSLFLRNYVQELSTIISLGEEYTSDGPNTGNNEIGLGLRNPMIYYQISLLIIYTLLENKLSLFRGYYVIRNCYFYSTILLIVLSDFLILSGRLSSVFATLEIIIVPQILYALKKHFISVTACGLLYCAFFFLNLYQFYQK